MRQYIFQRLFYMIFLVRLVSIVTFFIIELPPGDYVSTYISRLEQNSGEQLSEDIIEGLQRQYGLDLPSHQRYFKWFGQALQGEFGLAIPNFMLALILLYIAFKHFGINLTGLFSPEYLAAPWSLAKIGDLLLQPADSDYHRRHRRHSLADTGAARDAAGRAQQAICDYCPQQRRRRSQVAVQISGAGSAESDCQQFCLAVSSLGFRQRNHRNRAGFAGSRTDAAPRHDCSRYLFGDNSAAVCHHSHGDRHERFRHSAGGGRPAHSDGMQHELMRKGHITENRL